MALSKTRVDAAGQAQASLLHCFASALDADAADLVLGLPEPAFRADGLQELFAAVSAAPGLRVVASWSRSGEPVPPSLAEDALISTTMRAGNAFVNSPDEAAIKNGSEPPPCAVAAPVHLLGSTDPAGVLHATFKRLPRLSPAELSWTAEAFASTAALCLLDSGGIATTMWARMTRQGTALERE